MFNLNDLMSDYQKINRYKETEALANKWKRTGLLEGIDKEHKIHNMARLLENQAKQLIDESSLTSTTTSREEWSNVALPLVRRTFAKIVSQDLLSVQPMAMPSGLIFWLYFNYGTNKPTNTNIYTSGESLYGNTSASSIDGNLYDFDYSYTKNYVSASAVAATFATASWADFNYDQDLSASVAANANHFKKVTVAFSALTRPDKEAVSAYNLVDTNNVITNYRSYATKDANNAYFLISGSHTASVDTVEYVQQTTAGVRGDFEAGQTGVGPIPQLDIQLKSEAIVAISRKLKAIWSQEITQDLQAYQSIDAEAELTNVLSEYIALEIDMELLQMLWHDAAVTDFWSAKMSTFLDASNGSAITGQPTFYGTQQEWYQTLIQKITKVSNEIHKRTLRGGANWLVVGTKIATILESMKPGFVDDVADIESEQYAMGLMKIGTLNSRWTVYKNPYFRDDAILLGFRGGNFLETGAVYAPYVPLITSPVVYDQNTFQPRKGVMTRYAKKMIRPEFYGKIIVRDTHLI